MLTVSLELAIRMDKLGWRDKKSYFVRATGGDKCEEERKLFTVDDDSFSCTESLQAPTAQEILDELPDTVEYKRGYYYLRMCKAETAISEEVYHCGYHSKGEVEIEKSYCAKFGAIDLAEALGQLRCWCKENGYLDANKE